VSTYVQCSSKHEGHAPDHRNTTLKVHVGPVSGHVANWGAVEETLRGTRYEHLLAE